MDITLLRTFLEVYRLKHFGRAADKLFITQSAVSARIHQIEEQLGVKLFARDRNNIQLTAAGQKFLPYAETLLRTWGRACQEIRAQTPNNAQLTISGEPGLWDILLEQWLTTLKHEMPTLALSVNICSADKQLRELAEESIDLIFTYDPPIEQKFVVRKALSLPLILVSTQPGISVLDVFSGNYVLVDWGQSFLMKHNDLFPDAKSPAIRIQPENSSALQILHSQNAAAYLAKPLIEKLLEQKVLHLVSNAPLIEKTVYTAHQQHNERIGIIEHTLQYMNIDKNINN